MLVLRFYLCGLIQFSVKSKATKSWFEGRIWTPDHTLSTFTIVIYSILWLHFDSHTLCDMDIELETLSTLLTPPHCQRFHWKAQPLHSRHNDGDEQWNGKTLRGGKSNNSITPRFCGAH